MVAVVGEGGILTCLKLSALYKANNLLSCVLRQNKRQKNECCIFAVIKSQCKTERSVKLSTFFTTNLSVTLTGTKYQYLTSYCNETEPVGVAPV